MEQTNKTPKRKLVLLGMAGAILVLVAAVTVYFTLLASSQYRYTISDGTSVVNYTTSTTDIPQVLEEAQIPISEKDRITDSKTSRNTVSILIERCMGVTVEYQGKTLTAETYEGTVEDILKALDITLAEGDYLTAYSQPILQTEKVYDGMTIRVVSTAQETYTKTVSIPYETITYLDPTLTEGETQVKIAGVAGRQEVTYEKTGEKASKTDTVISTRLLASPVDEVLLIGTGTASEASENTVVISTEATVAAETQAEPEVLAAEPQPESTPEPSPAPEPEPTPYIPAPVPEPEPPAANSGNYITTASGEALSYSSVLSVEATAYTGGGTTATGTSARYGAIAVDPKVIPYGTRMYIVSDDGKWIYGEATAEDCGGAIKGNIIDLYFDDYNTCIQFGRRNCTVYILD